jgi:hypothetical protein
MRIQLWKYALTCCVFEVSKMKRKRSCCRPGHHVLHGLLPGMLSDSHVHRPPEERAAYVRKLPSRGRV